MVSTAKMTRTMLTLTEGDGFFIPDWPMPPGVCSLMTTRQGGVSREPFASFNLGDHVGDDPGDVHANRALLGALIKATPAWLNQVHGTQVVDAASVKQSAVPPAADASFSRQRGVGCVVMTADCLPVLFCDDAGQVVAAAHAGWRGLLAGVLEATVAAMGVAPQHVMAYLGPAIGPLAFEVGEEVRAAFVAREARAAQAFKPLPTGKWLADIYLLARQRLSGQGVERVFGGSFCTVSDAAHFYSYRRDGQTGRMASLIWISQAA
jgi:YfiH family protein